MVFLIAEIVLMEFWAEFEDVVAIDWLILSVGVAERAVQLLKRSRSGVLK